MNRKWSLMIQFRKARVSAVSASGVVAPAAPIPASSVSAMRFIFSQSPVARDTSAITASTSRWSSGSAALGLEQPREPAAAVARDAEHRVDGQAYRDAPAVERRRDGADQEGHVVRHHLDDGVLAAPAVFFLLGVVHAHDRLLRLAPVEEQWLWDC